MDDAASSEEAASAAATTQEEADASQTDVTDLLTAELDAAVDAIVGKVVRGGPNALAASKQLVAKVRAFSLVFVCLHARARVCGRRRGREGTHAAGA